MLNFLYKSLEHAFCYFGMLALFCFQALTSSNIILWFIVCYVVAIIADLFLKHRRGRMMALELIKSRSKAN